MSDQTTALGPCLVTGASTGIGNAIACHLAAHGHSVFAAVRTEGDAQSLRGLHDTLQPIQLDLTNDSSLTLAATAVTGSTTGTVNVVHCAGTYVSSPWQEADVEDLDRLYQTNVRGPYLLTQKLLPGLLRPGGNVVFINSSSGLRARAGAGAFSATQHALKALADSLRDELNAAGVRVVSIFPGRTATQRMARLFAREQKVYQPELLVQPEDVARLVRFALTQPSHVELTDLHIRPARNSY